VKYPGEVNEEEGVKSSKRQVEELKAQIMLLRYEVYKVREKELCRRLGLREQELIGFEEFSLLHQEPCRSENRKGAGIITIRQAEQELILKTLEQTNGNRSRAARLLGISLRKLRYRLKEYREAGFEPPPPDRGREGTRS
jgi:DNA-binding NtrC family response regulator